MQWVSILYFRQCAAIRTFFLEAYLLEVNTVATHLYKHTHLRSMDNHTKFAFLKCRGELISFLDVDDYWLSNKISKQIDLINKNQPMDKGLNTKIELLLKKIENNLSTHKLSPFEQIICCALKFFDFKKVDLLILEAGLGGRLDATTAHHFRPIIAIGNIGLDHKEYLGDSIEKIAKEKRKQFQDQKYWGKPVTGFGDLKSEILMVGLAPAAHGGTRSHIVSAYCSMAAG